MKNEEKILRSISLVAILVMGIVLEFILTLTLLILNGIPAFFKGYWSFAWIFIITWVLMTIMLWTAISIVVLKHHRLLKKAKQELKHRR